MLIRWIEPVSSFFLFIAVEQETLLFIYIERNITVVDSCIERAIKALDVSKLICEDELGNETARPRILLNFLRCF